MKEVLDDLEKGKYKRIMVQDSTVSTGTQAKH